MPLSIIDSSPKSGSLKRVALKVNSPTLPKLRVVLLLVAVVSALKVKHVELFLATTVAPEGIPVPLTDKPTTILALAVCVICLTLVEEPSDKPDV